MPFRLILACYAVAVALNGFLPANLGTFVMLVMFTTLIAGATFPLVFSGLIVEKIPFSVFNVALYLYLFLTVSGSFSIKLGFLADHTGLVVLLVVGAIVLLVLLARIFWERLEKLRQQLVSGGAILRSPRRTATRLFLPVLGSYAARLAIVAVFLGAYSIPVTFENVATVTASNSVSNSVSATPGGVGVTQAMNSAALSGSTSAKTATAYSIGQQLIISAWDVIFAIILVSWVFGWSGGKQLVESSYGEAKERSRELRKRRSDRRLRALGRPPPPHSSQGDGRARGAESARPGGQAARGRGRSRVRACRGRSRSGPRSVRARPRRRSTGHRHVPRRRGRRR